MVQLHPTLFPLIPLSSQHDGHFTHTHITHAAHKVFKSSITYPTPTTVYVCIVFSTKLIPSTNDTMHIETSQSVAMYTLAFNQCTSPEPLYVCRTLAHNNRSAHQSGAITVSVFGIWKDQRTEITGSQWVTHHQVVRSQVIACTQQMSNWKTCNFQWNLPP